MTVEFLNSHNSVWQAIQLGLRQVGFVVADVPDSRPSTAHL